MNPNGILARILRPVARAVEGAFRPGPYYLPVTGGWLSADVGQHTNWWQLGYLPEGGARSAIVEACISAYSQTVAICPGDHWKLNNKGGRTRVTTSALARILRRPNAYQTISDFLLNLTDALYREGNAYALALRNDRYEVSELHLMDPRQSLPQLANNGEVFYRLQGNDVIQRQLGGEQLIVPQRDVLHVRMRSERYRYPHPLVGESPLTAATQDIVAGDAIIQQQINFYMNQARPSAVITSDREFTKDQTQELRDRWEEQSKGINQGRTPVLGWGLKVQPWGVVSKDAAIAEVLKLSDQRIALAFRMPLQILGIGGTPFASAELLMQSWVALGLGFALNHIEEGFGQLYQLKGQPEEYAEFDTEALLRSSLKERIDSLVKGVQGGVYSPNEARAREGLDEVKFGDEPRLQAQVVPLSAAQQIPSAPSSHSMPGVPGESGATPAKPSQPNSADAVPAKDQHANVQRELDNLRKSVARARRRFTTH
jgi:HK97 family phage portal protein